MAALIQRGQLGFGARTAMIPGFRLRGTWRPSHGDEEEIGGAAHASHSTRRRHLGSGLLPRVSWGAGALGLAASWVMRGELRRKRKGEAELGLVGREGVQAGGCAGWTGGGKGGEVGLVGTGWASG